MLLDSEGRACYVQAKMKIAAVLPHVEVFGGVRRYIEIGNELTARGHHFVLFHPEGKKPDWLEFKGITRPFDSLEGQASDPSGQEVFDAALCSEYSILPYFDKVKARLKFFYFVLEGHKREKKVVKKDYIFLGASEGICRRIERKYKVRCYKAAGGINPKIFYPIRNLFEKEDSREKNDMAGTEDSYEKKNCLEIKDLLDIKDYPDQKADSEIKDSLGNKVYPNVKNVPDKKPQNREFRILSYGRIYKKRKGIHLIIRAVEGLYKKYPQLKLIFFDTLVGKEKQDPRALIQTRVPHEFYLNLPQEKMAWLFSQADLFVSAERRAGWTNTAAEAMACRIPVICTRSGTRDFAIPNKTALVIPFPFLIRRGIKKLLQDDSVRLRLAEAGYVHIQSFSWSALARSLETIIQERLKELKPSQKP